MTTPNFRFNTDKWGKSTQFRNDCVITNIDPDGSGVGVVPRYVLFRFPDTDGAAIRGYFDLNGVTLAVNDIVRVRRDDDRTDWEIDTVNGNGGTATQRVYQLYDPALTNVITETDSNSDLTTDADFFAGGTERGIVEATYLDRILFTDNPTDHFRQNSSATPPGWSTVSGDSANASDTESFYSFWQLSGTSSDTSWFYQNPTGIDIDSADITTRYDIIWNVIWFDSTFTADVNYRLGIYGTDAGIDLDTYALAHIQWDASGGTWQIRGETRDRNSLTTVTSSFVPLPAILPFPFWVGVRVEKASKESRFFFSTERIANGQTSPLVMMNQFASLTPAGTPSWDELRAVTRANRGAGTRGRLAIAAVEGRAN